MQKNGPGLFSSFLSSEERIWIRVRWRPSLKNSYLLPEQELFLVHIVARIPDYCQLKFKKKKPSSFTWKYRTEYGL